jgi:hypothetical protein
MLPKLIYASNNESTELVNPNDRDTSRQVKTSEKNKINHSVNQIDVAKFKEEVKNQNREKTVNLSRITPLEELYTQQTIELQDVILGNNAVGRTLEINIKKEVDWKYWKIRPPPKRKKKVKG